MRYPLIALALGALLAPLTSFAQAEKCVSATGRSVSVSGAATIAMRPDRVTFSVGVQTEAVDVAEAFRQNSRKVNAVIAALKKLGVTQPELQTSNLAIDSRDEEGKRLHGFRVSNIVTVTREDPAGVGELLQAAVAAGANQAGSLRFFVADPDKHVPRGLEMAFQNARSKAERLASLSGKALGDVVCITDSSSNFAAYGFAAQNITVTANAPEVAVGQETLAFNVSVVFELK
jgi:uncharacterized protein YggE